MSHWASSAESGTEGVRCGLAVESLRSFGHLRLQVTGWSMFPAIRPDDTLSIERVDAYQVSEGDLVLFERERRLFVHRVIRSIPGRDEVLTRGDAMPKADPELRRSHLQGKVIAISRQGRLIQPKRTISLGSRALSLVFRSSRIFARVLMRLDSMRRSNQVLEGRVLPCPD